MAQTTKQRQLQQPEMELNGTLATHIQCDYIKSNISNSKTWKHIQTHTFCGATSELE